MLPDLIGKRINITQHGGLSYTGRLLGLGEKKGHRCAIMQLAGQLYFIPIDNIWRMMYVSQEIPP